MSGVRPDERRGPMRWVRRTLQPLKSLETVEANSVQAGEARHQAQRRGVKTEDVRPEAEAEARPVQTCQVRSSSSSHTWTSSRGRTRRPAWTCLQSRGRPRPWAWPPCSWWRCIVRCKGDTILTAEDWSECELSVLSNLIAFSLMEDEKWNTKREKYQQSSSSQNCAEFHFAGLHNPSLISNFFKVSQNNCAGAFCPRCKSYLLHSRFPNLKYVGINHQDPWWVLIWTEMLSRFKIELKRFFTRLITNQNKSNKEQLEKI